MRLIDAEKCPCLTKCYSNRSEVHSCLEPCDELKKWFLTTTYDVDKVVKEIDRCSIDNTDWGYSTNPKLASYYLSRTAEVIDIVKRGGADEN